ncbi:MAG: mucoidy inhibitor MuiA family protein [Bacteroidales bacterium]|nr:mucoidy inhibitor MuiA family protein [Candidatus Colimorpha pelethequi]
MKKLFLSVALLAVGTVAFAQTEVQSKIDKVTIYPNGALVEKSATVNLRQGDNKLIFSGNANSIQVDGVHFSSSPDWFISAMELSHNTLTNKVAAEKSLPAAAFSQYQTLANKQDDLLLKVKNNNSLISTLNKQLSALNNLKAVKSPEKFDTIDNLKAQFEYQRSEAQRINAAISKAQSENDDWYYQLSQINSEMEALLQRNTGGKALNKIESGIEVSIYANRPLNNAHISYSYFVENVRCFYSYDAMLDEDLHRAIFMLKASVSQNTGEHWRNCPIVFSTHQAGYAGFDQALYPYYLDFVEPITYRANGFAKSKAMMRNTMTTMEMVDAAEEVVVAEEALDFSMEPSAGQEFTLSREYTLNTKQTIPFDPSMKGQTMLLTSDTTNIAFARFSTPKIEEKVYYTALLPEWESLGLLDASCAVYLNNKFVSRSDIATSGVGDTLRFSIGEDRNVNVTRKVVKSSPDKSGLLSKEIEETVTVKLTLKNTKNEKVEVTLKDQVPLSGNAEIKVGNVVTGSAEYNSQTGLLRWLVTLEPRQEKTVTFSYTVKYPKGKNLREF